MPCTPRSPWLPGLPGRPVNPLSPFSPASVHESEVSRQVTEINVTGAYFTTFV